MTSDIYIYGEYRELIWEVWNIHLFAPGCMGTSDASGEIRGRFNGEEAQAIFSHWGPWGEWHEDRSEG